MLGPLEVLSGAPQHWKPVEVPKVRILLVVLLAARGRVVSLERLVHELWFDGGQEAKDHRNLLHQYVMRLRRQLGDRRRTVLVTQSPGYRLLLEPEQLDVSRFDELCARGQDLFAAGRYDRAVAVFGEALALWRGAPLEDVPPSPSVVAEAERLREARLAAAEMCVDASHRTGEYAATLAELRALRDDHPLREGLWEKEMTALHACGRRAEALELYQLARRTFRTELGLEPGASLRTLQRRILEGGQVHRPSERTRQGTLDVVSD
ncbi:AfsR/SARP family transcriptional regulator [Streptomyces lanatus]|uniref:AfsR/SARP family transcriptional regulator n=1 Tax=Streptomyces lanatus TaxID=66900 RepID=A0ABV1Y720_9ACTN|nr:AfsR/SARP family transcriptional regulator [Streptomyces lanatus]